MQRLYFLFIIGFFVVAVALGTSKASEINKLNTGLKVPSPTPAPTQKAEVDIVVLSPDAGQSVENPFLVRGRARVFENIVSIKLRDKKGRVLTETTTYASAPDVGQFGDFETYVGYSTPEAQGTLEVYQASAKDGSPIDLVKIPLNFK